jgi:hypothetical protein
MLLIACVLRLLLDTPRGPTPSRLIGEDDGTIGPEPTTERPRQPQGSYG